MNTQETQDGGVIIDFAKAKEQMAINQSQNLVMTLEDGVLTTIGDKVVTNFDSDLASRAEWEKRRGNWYKLFAGRRDPKNFPWENCSNVGIPTIGIAVLHFQARAYESLFGQKELVRAKWKSLASKDKALRCSKYMNYQLTEEMEEWEEDMDAMLIQLPLNGSCFKKTYYDRLKKRPVSVYLNVDDFVVPYSARRLETSTRKTHILRMNLNDFRQRVAIGEYLNAEDLTSASSSTNFSPSVEQSKDLVSGQDKSVIEPDDQRLLLEQHCVYDLNEDGIGEHYIITVDYETKKVLRIESREYEDGNGTKNVVEFFTHYGFIPNPEGFYCFGFGHLLEGLNEAINSITNQLIDSGTLSNIISGMVSKRSGVSANDIKLAMGKFKTVDASSDDIRKAIYQFEFNPPSQVLFRLLSLLQDYASKISTVSDSMTGQIPPSDTAATTTLAVLEQGLKVFSTIQRRIHRALRKELKKLFIINSIFLDERVYAQVLDDSSLEYQTFESGRSDFESTIDVVPTADPNMASKAERLLIAQQSYQFVMQNPLTAQDPDSIFIATQEYLRALGAEEILRTLKKPQPQTPPDLSPDEEHAGFLREKSASVLPQQNHGMHLQQHNEFMDTDWFHNLTPHGKNLHQAHVKDTMAALYLHQKSVVRHALK